MTDRDKFAYMEQIRDWNEAFAKWKAEKESADALRDTFAAAALTGLLATGQGPYHGEGYFAKAAYKAADAMLRERGVTEPMPTEKRAEVSEQGPAAWATFYPNGSTASVYIGRVPPHAVPLYRHQQLTLTDEERAAVERVCVAYELLPTAAAKQVADTLSKLLERLA